VIQLSPGQRLALDQLEEIAERSQGALEIVGGPADASGAYVRLHLSIATAEYRQEGGFTFRQRERLVLRLYPDFPFTKPDLYFDHKRFIGQPHVQWGSYICLYQSAETEYRPADGLFGFFERVDVWMRAAGAGQLDPDDAPLHPPVAYRTSSTYFVAKADTPPEVAEEPYWIGRADLKKVRDHRFDIVGWTSLDDWDDPDHPIALAVLLKQPLATEYPTKVYDLIKLVEAAGLSFVQLYRMLRLLSLFADEGEPARMVFGAPMRRKAAGEPLKPHLTVWEIAAEPLAALRQVIRSDDADNASRTAVLEWLVKAEIEWCLLLEDRPEIVHRRDQGAPASFLAGKRVLLLGCGALGSALGETIVRAGAVKLGLADKSFVKPGILVRQRYTDDDIGVAKPIVLKEHLDELGFPSEISAHFCDLADGILSRFAVDEWDLVIDTTASTSVHHRLERELAEQPLSIPLLSLSVSAAARHGSVSVKMPGYSGGLRQISRQIKLKVFARDAAHPLVKAFWPAPEDLKVFQPEPGCSAPTFVGSAADIDSHAAALLNIGLLRVGELTADEASVDLIAAPWLSVDAGVSPRLGYRLRNDQPATDLRHGYRVLRSDAAARGMATEMRRIARTRSDNVETGGLIFGEIDDSHRVIWIDSVSGPPPDSQASPEKFLCGTAGTKQVAAFRAKASGGSSRFIGIWHTHPVSRGRPSEDDLTAMFELLHLQEFTPRQVVMLIIGFAATEPTENYYLFRRNEFRLIAAEEQALGEGA
jgi:proteasome lid subunit RPN8/RPN11